MHLFFHHLDFPTQHPLGIVCICGDHNADFGIWVVAIFRSSGGLRDLRRPWNDGTSEIRRKVSRLCRLILV